MRIITKNFEVVYTEAAADSKLAALVGGKYHSVAPSAVERVTERNYVMQSHDRAVGFLSPLRYKSSKSRNHTVIVLRFAKRFGFVYLFGHSLPVHSSRDKKV